MPKQLIVSNLGPATSSLELTRMFAGHGTVRWAEVLPSSKAAVEETSGLVEMASDAEGDAAVAAMNGREHAGRNLSVRVATARQRSGGAAAATPAGKPLFGAMNMTDESVARVSLGPTRLDFGDRGGTDKNRGLPVPGEPVHSPATASGGWGQFVPVTGTGAPFRPAWPDAPGEKPATAKADAGPEMDRVQQGTYDSIFSHPVPRGLHWPEVRSMLGALGAVDVAEDGAMRAVRNGQTLTLKRPRKNVASPQDVMDIRRFIERSNTREQR